MTSRKYSIWLWLLLGLFCFRVLAQFIQWHGEVPFLPPFAAWHSALVPYGLLLSVQFCIIACLGKVAFDFSTGRVIASRRAAGIWLILGTAYMSIMIIRLMLGLTLLDDHYWFSNHLPTVFHIVLAAFLILVGRYHRQNARIA